MNIKQVISLYFSPTHTGKTATEHLGLHLSRILHCPHISRSFTLPEEREAPIEFKDSDLVLLTTPTYAGRVPNLMLKFLESIRGGGAKGIALTMFGNRSFDDALYELKDIMQACGFVVLGAAAVVGQHSFSDTLAVGRPDAKDLNLLDRLAEKVADKIQNPRKGESDFFVKGRNRQERTYYQPSHNGTPIDIRKVKPLTHAHCTRCRLCVEICPMGSISVQDPAVVEGICIKCGACVRFCPHQAKYFDDEGYLTHVHDLETRYSAPASSEIFY